MFFRTLAVLILLCVGSANAAEGLERLTRFTDELTTFSGRFSQTVYDAKSNPTQVSSGEVYLQRPGKFSWHYQEPASQLIVADGKKIWVYDEDLAQVTVKTVDESLSQTPIMLLSGEKSLNTQFSITELGERDGIEWLELSPKEADTDFESIYLGLDSKGLIAMELRDNFGQATQIQFQDTKVNQQVDVARFSFTPPKGVDVIGE